ncbi:GNAT family N-acetyltransferase [Streptomyces sp. MK5]|uniref:GNAT family N-acetyltransferase n=1 Tax=Streptomyces sp. MK5 TaxID=3064253 RepID=UPI0027407C75|nr:GNAT family protein [Streptomyces sp. MK5]
MPDEITLRPVTADDLDLFERGFDGPEGTGPYQWFGFASSAGLRRQSAENGLLGADGGVLSVAEAGRTVGRVEWFAGTWGRPPPPPAGRRRSAWCRPRAAAAQAPGPSDFRPSTSSTTPGPNGSGPGRTACANLAEQRALEKAGFVRKGVLRSAQWRGGRWHDQVIFSMLRTERSGGAQG